MALVLKISITGRDERGENAFGTMRTRLELLARTISYEHVRLVVYRVFERVFTAFVLTWYILDSFIALEKFIESDLY